MSDTKPKVVGPDGPMEYLTREGYSEDDLAEGFCEDPGISLEGAFAGQSEANVPQGNAESDAEEKQEDKNRGIKE